MAPGVGGKCVCRCRDGIPQLGSKIPGSREEEEQKLKAKDNHRNRKNESKHLECCNDKEMQVIPGQHCSHLRMCPLDALLNSCSDGCAKAHGRLSDGKQQQDSAGHSDQAQKQLFDPLAPAALTTVLPNGLLK